MEGLASEMTTRFVGFFPKNMRDVNQVLSQAEKTVDIMTDYVGYGHYSAPDEFERYLRWLQDLRSRGVVVRMLVYSKTQAQYRYRTQFTQADFDKAIGKTSKNHRPAERLVAFCKKFNSDFCRDFNEQKSPLKKENFELFMFHKQTDYLEDLLERGVQIKQTAESGSGQPMPFFLWCEDNTEAVFSFLNDEKDTQAPREVSFRTRDSRLVSDTLAKRFQEMWNDPKNKEIKLVGVESSRRPSWDVPPAAPEPQHSPQP